MAIRSGKRKGSAKSQPPTFMVCSKYFGLIYRGMSPLFFVIASTGCAQPGHQCVSSKKTYFEQCGTNAIKRGESLSSALRNFYLCSSDIPFPTVGKPVNISLMRKVCEYLAILRIRKRIAFSHVFDYTDIPLSCWFHRQISHCLNISGLFIVPWLAFSMNEKIICTYSRKRLWKPCKHTMSEWYKTCMSSSIMYQHTCAVLELLSRRWGVSMHF